MAVEVKICGLRSPAELMAAIQGGARYVGLVFYPASPRALAPEAAGELARMTPAGVKVVGVFVDPEDSTLEEVLGQVPLDIIQLHGRESPRRVAQVRDLARAPVIKALAIRGESDFAGLDPYREAADLLLFDSKPPEGVAALPGGTGMSFDWSLLSGRAFDLPWMLSGGLSATNLAQAVATTGARIVDVSSGVEDRPGHKDPERIRGFLQTAADL